VKEEKGVFSIHFIACYKILFKNYLYIPFELKELNETIKKILAASDDLSSSLLALCSNSLTPNGE
jgi:hypothetical protein